jgi:hypothetical protein
MPRRLQKLQEVVMFEIVERKNEAERATKAPVILPTIQLDFYADLYLGNPELRLEHSSFERFLVFVVRNGTIFERMRHRKPRRYGHRNVQQREVKP